MQLYVKAASDLTVNVALGDSNGDVSLPMGNRRKKMIVTIYRDVMVKCYDGDGGESDRRHYY